MTTTRDDKTGSANFGVGDPETADRDASLLLGGLARLARDEEAELNAFSGPVAALPDSARERLTAQIVAVQRAASGAAGDSAAPAKSTGPPLSVLAGGRLADDEVPSGRRTMFGRTPVPKTRRRALFVASATGLMAAAAAFAFWMRIEHRGPALPEYALAVTGGIQELRSGHADAEEPARAVAPPPVRLRPDSALVVTLRPAVGVEGSVGVRAFFIATANGAAATAQPATELSPRTRIAPSGAAELRLLGREIVQPATVSPQTPVRGLLRIVVGRPAAISRIAPNDVPSSDDAAHWFDVAVSLDAAE